MDYMIGEEDVFYDADEDETLDNETESLPTTASGHASTSVMSTVRNSQVFDNDRLEKCGRWLAAIPRDDVITLRQTPEYEEFLEAFDRLGHAHRRVISMNRIRLDLDATMHSESEEDEEQQVVVENRRQGSNFSFLQHLAVDDVILKIFLYIECQALVKTSETCSRFRELAYRSAVQRTQYVANTRQLNNAMQLLRAKEQIDGIGNLRHYFHVRVPMLGLRRRVIVTNAGDPDYNGVYFCTGASSNGFVFTKPRSPERRVMSVGTLLEALPRPPPPPGGGLPLGADGAPPLPQMIAFGPRNGLASNGEGGTHRGQLLKCVIARRFSNDVSEVQNHVLWGVL